MTENIHVTRFSLYESPDGRSLQFVDAFPENTSRGSTCSCTETVHERPALEPYHVYQGFSIDTNDTVFHKDNWLTFWTPGDSQHQKKGHAYFCSAGRGKLNIEITMEGYGYANCFFAYLNLGNQVDLSTMIDGHTSSRVDLSKINSNTLWLQDSFWGLEEIRILEDSKEIALWTEVMTAYIRIHENMNPILVDMDSSVQQLHDRLTSNDQIRADVALLREILKPFVEAVKTTELFRLVNDMHGALKSQNAARRRARDLELLEPR